MLAKGVEEKTSIDKHQQLSPSVTSGVELSLLTSRPLLLSFDHRLPRLNLREPVMPVPPHALGKRELDQRDNMLHIRNQHLRNRGGFSVTFVNGLSVAFSNNISVVSGIFKRIATCPVEFHWNCPMDVQCHFPTSFHLCDFWCNMLPRD